MALTAGVEPAASPLGGEHSIQLSYASILYILTKLSGSLSIIFLMILSLGGLLYPVELSGCIFMF